MKTQLPILIGIALLLAASLVMGSYLVIYHHDYAIEMEDLEIHSKEYQGGVLTITLSTTVDGEFLYRVTGKQPSQAQKPGSKKATLTVEIPAGYGKVVCGRNTLYTIS